MFDVLSSLVDKSLMAADLEGKEPRYRRSRKYRLRSTSRRYVDSRVGLYCPGGGTTLARAGA